MEAFDLTKRAGPPDLQIPLTVFYPFSENDYGDGKMKVIERTEKTYEGIAFVCDLPLYGEQFTLIPKIPRENWFVTFIVLGLFSGTFWFVRDLLGDDYMVAQTLVLLALYMHCIIAAFIPPWTTYETGGFWERCFEKIIGEEKNSKKKATLKNMAAIFPVDSPKLTKMARLINPEPQLVASIMLSLYFLIYHLLLGLNTRQPTILDDYTYLFNAWEISKISFIIVTTAKIWKKWISVICGDAVAVFSFIYDSEEHGEEDYEKEGDESTDEFEMVEDEEIIEAICTQTCARF